MVSYDTRIVQIRLRNKLNASYMFVLSNDNRANLQIKFELTAKIFKTYSVRSHSAKK